MLPHGGGDHFKMKQFQLHVVAGVKVIENVIFHTP